MNVMCVGVCVFVCSGLVRVKMCVCCLVSICVLVLGL